MGTLLRCGVLRVTVNSNVYTDPVEVGGFVKEFSPRDADLVAQSVFDLTDMPEDEVENLGSG